jgi:hypothetical protein
MQFRTVAPIGLICLVALAGCVESEGSAAVTPPMTGGDLDSVAANACRAAIAQTANIPVSDVAVFDVAEAEAGVGVRATVAGADEPWACQSSPSGVVAGVSYTGSEGAL